MGVVYLGSVLGPGGFEKLVAVKTIAPAFRDSVSFIRMMKDEARIASRLQHPNVVQLYEMDQEGTTPYLVMEYVHGDQLSTLLEIAGRLPDRLAVRLALDICDALAYAHGLVGDDGRPAGLVHRDVSPQNILVSYEGVPKLVDFGIARAVARPRTTTIGGIKGKPSYMAPEQREGLAIDSRADLYALGVVLYEATVGRHPSWSADGPTPVDVTPRILPHPGTLRADYSVRLWHLIARATAAEPDRRFESAREMLTALQECSEELGRPVSRPELQEVLATHLRARMAAKDRLIATRGAPDSSEGVGSGLLAAASGAGAVPGAEPMPASTPLDLLVAGRHTRLDTVATPGRSPGTARRTHGRLGRVAAAGGAVAALAAGAAMVGTRRSATVAPTSPRRICVLPATAGTEADRAATLLVARLVSRALESAPAAVPVHAYHAVVRYGWDPEGMARARKVCRDVGAEAIATIEGVAGGRTTLAVEGAGPAGPEPVLAEGGPGPVAAAVAVRIHRALGGPSGWAPAAPLLTADAAAGVERAWTAFRLERYRDALDEASGVLRHHPEHEDAFLIGLVARWWQGLLDRPEAREAVRAPPGAGPRIAALVPVVLAIAGGDRADAARRAMLVTEDRRLERDALALYVAGEALVHGGRPSEGARYLSRALEVDPELGPAVDHVADHFLAAGDWRRVEALADLRERVNPATPDGAEIRARLALATARYEDAARRFDQLLAADTWGLPVQRSVWNVGLIYAQALGGDPSDALAEAERASTASAIVGVAAAMPEPIGYAICLARADHGCAATWSARITAKLGRPLAADPNIYQLAFVAALLDELAGQPAARERWLAGSNPASVPRRYRFEEQARALAALEARRGARSRAAPADADGDLAAIRLDRGFAAERRGDALAAAAELEGSIAASRDGELNCIASAALARARRTLGDAAGARAACDQVRRPFVPRPYCLVLRNECDTGPAP